MNSKGFTLIELLIVLVILGIIATCFAVLPMWTQHNLQFWASYIKHAPVIIPFWACVLAVFLGPINLAANILMYLGQFFI